jgi:hypothetical protein
MSTFKRGGVWWYKFKFAGQLIRESTKSSNRNIATAAERTRHAELENGFNRVGSGHVRSYSRLPRPNGSSAKQPHSLRAA